MAKALSSIGSISLSSDVYHPVIAAIDFGTSNSGYAYAFQHRQNEVIEPRAIQLNKWQIGSASSSTEKAPTTVLLKPDKTFDCFGYKAEDKYVRLCATNKAKGWWYFEKFKMALYNTKPEAASVYCRHTPSSAVRESGGELRLTTLPVGHRYIIVDLGGGTADIASHRIIKDECLHEVSNARGNDLGGQQFSIKFVDLLALVFGSENIETWKIKNKGHYLKMQRSIEGYKWEVSNSDEDIILEVPQSLLDILTEKSGNSMEDVVHKVSWIYPIKVCGSNEILLGNQLVKTFFNGILEGVHQHLSDIISQASGLHTVFLVGGMGKSAYIRRHIQKHFQNITLLVPEDPGVAVLKGAVLLGNRPQTIAGRIARYSYGIGVAPPFEEGRHKADYKLILDGKVLCNNVFEKLIEKGQVLKYGDKFTTTTCINAKLSKTKQRSFTTYLYQSTQLAPTYYTEEGCTELGGFENHPPQGGWPDYCEVTVEIVVGEAEFKFFVKDDLGRVYETKVDFLKSN